MKHKKSRLFSTKPGAVSMITVILMSIVLLVLVIGLVQIMVNEQQQSSDNELTNRAFYAAEAGLESARQYVSGLDDSQVQSLASTSLANADCLEDPNPSNPKLRGGIDATLIGDDNYEAKVVCQKIAGVGGTYTVDSEIGLNSPRQYNLGENKAKLKIDWGIEGEETGRKNFRANTDLPPVGASWDAPAALRLQLFSFNSGSNRSNLVDLSRELYILPANQTDGVARHSFNDIDEPVLADCDPGVSSEQKMCAIIIEDLPQSDTQFVRISYLYSASTTDLTPLFADDSTDDDLTGQLRVDTTGQVGDVFRRIQANVDVGNAAADGLPGYTLLGNQICKSFEVTDNTTDFPNINTNDDNDYCKETN